MNMHPNRGKFFHDALIRAVRDRFACVESDAYCGKRVCLENAGGTLTLQRVAR